MILLKNSLSKLAATALVAVVLSCSSKSDSSRSLLDQSSQDSTSQQDDQDNSAFAPTETTGGFLASSEIACSSFSNASSSGVHCRLLKNGRRIFGEVREGSRLTEWSIRIDDIVKNADGPGGIALTDGSSWDATWSQFTKNPWPKIESPSLAVTLRNGDVIRVGKIAGKIADFAAAVRDPSAGSSGSTGSSGTTSSTGGSSSGGSGKPNDSHLIFITKAKYHSPQDLGMSDVPSGLSCPNLYAVLSDPRPTGQAKAFAVSREICRCEAQYSGSEAIRAVKDQVSGLINTDASLVTFWQRFSGEFPKKIVDTANNLIANSGELIFTQPGANSAFGLGFTTVNPIYLDVDGHPVSSAANEPEPIWTGLLTDSSMSGLVGEPNCSNWTKTTEEEIPIRAYGGAVSRKDSNAFTGQSLRCGQTGDMARFYCMIP